MRKINWQQAHEEDLHYEIYSKGLWGSKLRDVSVLCSEAAWPPNNTTKESASGHGSDLGYATQTSLRIIKDTIGKHSVKSMIDIPCGDANWMFDSYVTDSLPFYLGLDVANATIELNRMRFAHHKNKMFTFWDATACVLPRYKHERSWPHPTWPSLQSPASSRQMEKCPKYWTLLSFVRYLFLHPPSKLLFPFSLSAF